MEACLLNTTFKRSDLPLADIHFFLIQFLLEKFKMTKLFYDYMMAPPFGMTMDPDKINLANIKNGGVDTPYPHVYINFCNYGNK